MDWAVLFTIPTRWLARLPRSQEVWNLSSGLLWNLHVIPALVWAFSSAHILKISSKTKLSSGVTGSVKGGGGVVYIVSCGWLVVLSGSLFPPKTKEMEKVDG